MESGEYEADFTELTSDTQKVGSISQQIDNTDFGVGIFRNSNFSFTLKNDKGLYSNVDTLRSIFAYKRTDSIVKITWDFKDYENICGFTTAQMPITPEVEVYRGLLTEISQASDIEDQSITFSCLGFESLFDREIVPYSSITNGDNISDIIFDCLNQASITSLLTVDAGNISVGNDIAIDTKDSLENRTVKEALTDLLYLTNSVLVIKDQIVYVRNRDVDAALSHTFYGQASTAGVENIISIKGFRDGFNRLFNFWTWKDTSLVSQDNTSVDTNGVYKNEIESQLIDAASTAKIQSILDANKNEFAFPKTEFTIDAPLDYDTLALEILNKVNVDYPNVYVPADSNPLPRYGQVRYGEFVYPYGIFPVSISSVDNYKILGKKIDTSKSIISFLIRKV